MRPPHKQDAAAVRIDRSAPLFFALVLFLYKHDDLFENVNDLRKRQQRARFRFRLFDDKRVFIGKGKNSLFIHDKTQIALFPRHRVKNITPFIGSCLRRFEYWLRLRHSAQNHDN